MFWDIPFQDSCNGISRDIPLWYIQVLLGISRDKQGYLCADLRDIQGYPRFSYFGESYPRLSSRMNAQNCLFRALECSNRAHSDLDKLMEPLFFIRGGGLAWQPPGAARRPCRAQDRRLRLLHPHLPEAWEARQRGGHQSPRLLAQERLVPAAPAQPC